MTTRRVFENKWIRYENGIFMGEPESKKGLTGNWITCVFLNSPTSGRKRQVKVKDEEHDICLVRYIR